MTDLRIINNNIELDREPIARILDVRATLRDKLEDIINNYEDQEAKIDQLTDTCNELQDEIAELKIEREDDAIR
tara:strand:- start:2014 stop:2235 length:222 start_codon:yes stop_codon:yes gene_type:complete